MTERNMHDPDSEKAPIERPWIALETTYDVEAWIDAYNHELQRFTENRNVGGYGICFVLAEDGEIYLHTTTEGDLLLDVTPEAEWAAPVIAAATRSAPPAGRIWALPGSALTPLILGLSSLIASTRTVVGHDFRIRKHW